MTEKVFTFPGSCRLKKKAEFQEVRSRGEKLYTRNLIIYYLKNQLSHPRLGITVSKKVSKKAVLRNKIKRRIREIFRIHQNELDSCDILVIARWAAVAAEYQELERNFINALTNAKVYKKNS